MNITSKVFENPNDVYRTKKERFEKLGIEKFGREISIFYKETKNLYGISNQNLITKIGCLITNKSISKLETDDIHNEYLFNKTVYMCDVELVRSVSSESLKRNPDKFLDMVKVTPTYAFSNSHIERIDTDEYIDLGVTMVNIDLKNISAFGKIEFSGKVDDKYQRILDKFIYNPKFYNHIDVQYDDIDNRDSYTGSLDEFKDSETKIIYNTFGSESVDNFVNGVPQKGIYVGKRVISISDFIKDVFNKKLFTPFENLEFIYNSDHEITTENFNLTKLKTYSTFSKGAGSKYIEDSIKNLIPKLIDICKKLCHECGEDLRLVCGLDKNFLIIDVYFYSDDRMVRITKPTYKLYGEFALSSEDFIDSVEINGEIVKSDMLESLHKTAGLLEFAKTTANTICLVDNYTRQLKMILEERAQSISDQISGVVSRARIENTKEIKDRSSEKDT